MEISLESLQTEKAKNQDISLTNCCCICGKAIKDGLENNFVHLLTNGNLIDSEDDTLPNSQGAFPVGNSCVKKLPKGFAFTLNKTI